MEHHEEEDGPWYFGKAKEEFHKRRRQAGNARKEEEDPIQVRADFEVNLNFCLSCLQWARERRDAERDTDFGPEDYFEGAMRGGNRQDADTDDFGETMLLVSLCIVISILLYIRTRIVERMRREQRNQGQGGEQPAQNGDRGVFPGPDDPARQDWAILR